MYPLNENIIFYELKNFLFDDGNFVFYEDEINSKGLSIGGWILLILHELWSHYMGILEKKEGRFFHFPGDFWSRSKYVEVNYIRPRGEYK